VGGRRAAARAFLEGLDSGRRQAQWLRGLVGELESNAAASRVHALSYAGGGCPIWRSDAVTDTATKVLSSARTKVVPSRLASGGGETLAVIDCDVHPFATPLAPNVSKFLTESSRRYFEVRGMPSNVLGAQIPPQRAFAHRIDSVPPEGRPGSDEAFARAQLLDGLDIDAGILNNQFGALQDYGSVYPLDLGVDVVRAFNEWQRESWLEADPRWFGAICVTPDQPDEAVKEIARCVESHDRFVQVLLSTRIQQPIGNPRYWPLLEAAEHFKLPLAFHVGGGSRSGPFTASGSPNYYFEVHSGFINPTYSLVASLIFEGAFDRFPGTKIVLAELGWSWAAPFGWRLDASWRVLRQEVPHLKYKPSEYLAKHFWFTTQPMEEPENPRVFDQIYEQFERAGLGEKLMYSSDYPHWDFDAPEALPAWLPEATRRKVLAGNASKLYGIRVRGSS
jgi:uncharacterized protein